MKTWDEPGFSPLFYTVEARQTRLCPRDKPGLVPGTNLGPKVLDGIESLCEKNYVPSSLARKILGEFIFGS